MADDRVLLERCLAEIERPSGATDALKAALRDRLRQPEAAPEAAIDVTAGSGGDGTTARPGEPGKPPIEGANSLWDTNQPAGTERS